MNVLFPSEIDVSSLEYSEMRPYGGQAKIIFVSHEGKPVVIQTPLMKCPYGLGRYDDGEKSKYSLDLSFGGNTKSVEKLVFLVCSRIATGIYLLKRPNCSKYPPKSEGLT